MVDVRGFRAIRYTELAGDAEGLITQPYDKIDAEMQREYYAKSPYNYCRLILPLEPNKYDVASQRIQDWLHEGVMAKDAEPSVFVCRQEFRMDGQTCVRTGVIAALRLYDYGENVGRFIAAGGSAVAFPQVWNANHGVADRVGFTLDAVKAWKKAGS